MAWLLNATRAFGVKVVNPGGVEQWKQGQGNVSRLDDQVAGFDITPRQILEALAQAVDRTRPCPTLSTSTASTSACPETPPPPSKPCRPSTAAASTSPTSSSTATAATPRSPPASPRASGPLVDYFNAHPYLTADVGQVIFGDATTAMTADAAVGQFLAALTGRKWYCHDVELETGCGVLPIQLRRQEPRPRPPVGHRPRVVPPRR